MPSQMDIQCALNAQLDIWWQASSWERGLPLDAEDPMKKEREAGGKESGYLSPSLPALFFTVGDVFTFS